MQESGDKDRITSVVILLAQDFCKSRNMNHRKGGLIGLAAASIGMAPDIDLYLHLLVLYHYRYKNIIRNKWFFNIKKYNNLNYIKKQLSSFYMIIHSLILISLSVNWKKQILLSWLSVISTL